MINIVRLSSESFLVDVGMNAKGPLVPIPLREGMADFAAAAPRRVRLVRDFIPEATSRCAASKQSWQLEQRYGSDASWTSVYAFHEIEFIPNDFDMINWYVTTHRRSWFTQQIVVGKLLLDTKGEEIVGDVTLFGDTLKKRVRGHTEQEIVCESEDERIFHLEDKFGIRLSARERRSICGTVSEIL